MSNVSPSPEVEPLPPAERELARELWDILAHATTVAKSEVARNALKKAPTSVSCAILMAYAAIWKTGRNPQFSENPFE
jgi:hypothetical protein